MVHDALRRLLPILLLTACTSSRADLSPADRDRLAGEVEAFLERHHSTLEAREPDAIRQLYVTDERFAWFEDGVKRYASPEDIVKALAAYPAGMSIETEYSGTLVDVLSPTLASVHTGFETKIGEGEASFAFGGVITMLLERDADWRIVTGHSSSRRPERR